MKSAKYAHYAFISHQSANSEFCSQLATDLDARGCGFWMYDWILQPGDAFIKEIEAAIQGCAVFLAVLSPGYSTSGFCQKELTRAWNLDKPIVPIFLETIAASDYPILLEGLLYVDFRAWRELSCYSKALDELIAALRTKAGLIFAGSSPSDLERFLKRWNALHDEVARESDLSRKLVLLDEIEALEKEILPLAKNLDKR